MKLANLQQITLHNISFAFCLLRRKESYNDSLAYSLNNQRLYALSLERFTMAVQEMFFAMHGRFQHKRFE